MNADHADHKSRVAQPSSAVYNVEVQLWRTCTPCTKNRSRQYFPNVAMKVYVIDGRRFSTLEGFYEEIGRVLIPDARWGHNLDAFNDILRGGFGTPEEGFTIRWKNHQVSKQQLGYSETVRQLELRLQRCHPSNRIFVSRDFEQARAHQRATVFEWLLEIIRDHGPGGKQEQDSVHLLLE